MARVVVDAMGGDHAPGEIVRGAIDAAAEGVDVVLVGDRTQISPVLDRFDADLPVVHASEVIEMHEDPARAVREKKDSSIMVAARLVKEGEAEAVISAGSTGAALAAAAFVIGRLKGVSRPAIASVFPTREVVLDVGANLDVRPLNLAQFGVMGSAVAKVFLDIDEPKVGLLNIGEEAGKGRDLEKEAHLLLAHSEGINFVGNVEGRDLGRSRADVFVTDGFTGNVLLKTGEGTSRALFRFLLEAMQAEKYQTALAELMPAFMELRQMIDPESIGGAHLVGTKGVVVIAHGASSHRAIANAAVMASEGAEHGLVDLIADGIGRTRG
ncbi:MAG: phosphate acyltransferase PlsX [Actinomycetota bacterium]|nr:phosphate acyltransferase PlsX [Actinomycetota bacterium]